MIFVNFFIMKIIKMSASRKKGKRKRQITITDDIEEEFVREKKPHGNKRKTYILSNYVMTKMAATIAWKNQSKPSKRCLIIAF